jgi:predicted ATPase
VYLKKIHLQNIKCFEDLILRFPHRQNRYGGWNVILGENGRGKSTLLRSIALGVLNPMVAFFALEQHEGEFARQGEAQAKVTADLVLHTVELQQTGETEADYRKVILFEPHGNPEVMMRGTTRFEESLTQALCYGYGPFRRLEGGPRPVPNAFQFPQPLSRFMTLFTDETGLAEATRGLIDLYIASVDPHHTAHAAAKQTLGAVCRVVNALLPGGVRLESVTSEKVRFKTASGVDLTEKELSDGYRSFLSLIFDLLRHLSARLGSAFLDRVQREAGETVVNVEAVVLIDEADAHLHPSWQRELGERLLRVFPKIQFIVTTHSPFVAQAATDGGLFVLRAGENGTDLPPFYGPGAVRVGSIVADGSSGRRSAADSARGAIAPTSAGVRYPSEL